MTKQDTKRPENENSQWEKVKNDINPVPEIQGKAKTGNAKAGKIN